MIHGVIYLSDMNEEVLFYGLQENTMLFYLLIFFLLLLGLIRVMDPFYFNELFRSTLDPNYINLMKREGKLGLNIVNLFLDLIFLGSIAFYVYQYPSPNVQNFAFWEIFLLVAVINLAHLLLNATTGYLFYGYGSVLDNLYDILIFNRVIGIVFLPLVFLITYFPSVTRGKAIIVAGILLLMFFAYRILRALFQGKAASKHGIVYNFFYLCTVEIAPLIIVIELVT